jgi:hypothetical protein
MTRILKHPYPPLPKECSVTLQTLVRMALEKNPNRRASIDDLLCVPELMRIVLFVS